MSVLVVGYGNTLRGDDALGVRIAELLAEDPRMLGARVEVRHQLTPELAEDIAAAGLVVLIDASARAARPGDVRVEHVAAGSHDASPAHSHAIDPRSLVELAQQVFGHAPPVVLVSVGAECSDLGAGVSAAVAAAIPRAVDTIVALVSDHRPGRRNEPVSVTLGSCDAPAGPMVAEV